LESTCDCRRGARLDAFRPLERDRERFGCVAIPSVLPRFAAWYFSRQ